MEPILDPRDGDFEDDASSTKQRTFISLAGSLLSEISLPKLAVVWMLLVGLPGLLLGAAPLLVSIWVASILSKAAGVFTEIGPALLLVPLVAVGWFAGRPLLRLAETCFWSLNALAVQPAYIAFREGLRHLAERLFASGMPDTRRGSVRAGTAAAAGGVVFTLGLGIVTLVWSATRWIVGLRDLTSPYGWFTTILANSAVLISSYWAIAALIWGCADAMMPQPRGLGAFSAPMSQERTWRVAHLSDIHTVGEHYGFRVESGRSGPRGNQRLRRALAQLDKIHAAQPLDVVMITGDLTDAGRSAEWAEFFEALAAYPRLAERVVALPGNHDVNVVDRASPARMELPTSPTKRLRQVRTLSALGALQGAGFRVVERKAGRLGCTLANLLKLHADDMAAFADRGTVRLSRAMAALWTSAFPLVLPPETDDGLGIVVLNSNAETHFSFTNALGLVSADQVRALEIVLEQYPRARWIVALHHHVVEYPQPAKALSERVGTALINGSWFLRRLQSLAGRVVVVHGHRHIDWIGECGGVLIVSAPSPVMDGTDGVDTYFYVHTFAAGTDGQLRMLEPERIVVPGSAEPRGL
jgi:Calcineurin-like phosphoesterase